MSLLESAKKTEFSGVYEKTKNDDIIFIIRYTVNKKTTTKIVGKKSEKMTSFLAYKIKLDNISTAKLSYINKKNGIYQEPFDFIELYIEFYNYRKAFLAKNTNANYKSHLNKYFKYKYENVNVQAITKNDLQLYINSLLEVKRPSTVEKIVITLRQFYKYLIDKGIVTYNPADRIILPRYDNKKYFSLPKKDVKKLIEYIINIKSLKEKAIYAFLLHGRRINEILTIKITNINFTTGVYKIESEQSKINKSQFWKLEKFQLDIVTEYLKTTQSNQNYLFENNNTKKQLSYTTIWRRHKILRDSLEMPNFTLHMFRHTIGFLLINDGYSLEVIARVLGHTNIVSTQRYSEMKIDTATKAYSKLLKSYINE